MKLHLKMELSGKEYYIGCITGENVADAVFTYDKEYMRQTFAVPVSISMPFQDAPFTPEQTRNFFEGLLPEGFTRRTVAHFIHADENDYLKILADLGRECLGALRVTEEAESREEAGGYDEISVDEIRALAKEGATKSAELVTKAHLSLTGASGKVGLYYDEIRDKWYLPRETAPSTHIVKQSHVRLNAIVVNEQLSMLTARNMGIDVPDSFIINTGGKTDAEILFASKRYDRKTDRHGKAFEYDYF